MVYDEWGSFWDEMAVPYWASAGTEYGVLVGQESADIADGQPRHSCAGHSSCQDYDEEVASEIAPAAKNLQKEDEEEACVETSR